MKGLLVVATRRKNTRVTGTYVRENTPQIASEDEQIFVTNRKIMTKHSQETCKTNTQETVAPLLKVKPRSVGSLNLEPRQTYRRYSLSYRD